MPDNNQRNQSTGNKPQQQPQDDKAGVKQQPGQPQQPGEQSEQYAEDIEEPSQAKKF